MSDWSSFQGDKGRHDKWREFLFEDKNKGDKEQLNEVSFLQSVGFQRLKPEEDARIQAIADEILASPRLDLLFNKEAGRMNPIVEYSPILFYMLQTIGWPANNVNLLRATSLLLDLGGVNPASFAGNQEHLDEWLEALKRVENKLKEDIKKEVEKARKQTDSAGIAGALESLENYEKRPKWWPSDLWKGAKRKAKSLQSLIFKSEEEEVEAEEEEKAAAEPEKTKKRGWFGKKKKKKTEEDPDRWKARSREPVSDVDSLDGDESESSDDRERIGGTGSRARAIWSPREEEPSSDDGPDRTPGPSDTGTADYNWGNSFGINSKSNADSLLKTFETRGVPPAIANSIADLIADLADDEDIVLEAVSLVGRADEPQRVISAESARELFDFLASLNMDKPTQKNVLKALNRWGNTNTVRFEKPSPKAPASEEPPPTTPSEPEVSTDEEPATDPEDSEEVEVELVLKDDPEASDAEPEASDAEPEASDAEPDKEIDSAAIKKAFDKAVEAWHEVTKKSAPPPAVPQKQWVDSYRKATEEFSKAYKAYKDLSPTQELGDPRNKHSEPLKEHKIYQRWRLIAGIK